MSSKVPEPNTRPAGNLATLMAFRVIMSRGLLTIRIRVWGASRTIRGINFSTMSQLLLVKSNLVWPGFWAQPAVKMTRSVPDKSSKRLVATISVWG